MLLAIGVVLAVVLVAFALNNKPASYDPKAVDYQASFALATKDGVIVPQLPQPVPTGWVPTSADYKVTATHPTKQAQWTVGFVTPEGKFVGIRQSNADSTKFIQEMTNNGEPQGTQMVGTQQWQRYVSTETDNRSLVLVGDKQTTVVTGTLDWERLGQVAQSLAPKIGG